MNEYKNGAYGALIPTEESQRFIDSVSKTIESVCEVEMNLGTIHHSTFLYTRSPCVFQPEHLDITYPLSAEIVDLTIHDDTKLIFTLESDDLWELHQTIYDKLQAKHAFEDFLPHITLSYNFTKPIPRRIRNVFDGAEILFDDFWITDLTVDSNIASDV